MVDHLSEEQIEGYRERSLPPSRLLAADRHLAECMACLSRLKEGASSRSACDQIRESLRPNAEVTSDHLSYETMEDYVKNRAGTIDQEIVVSHIEVCPACDKELQDLKEFAAMMAEEPGMDQEPAKQASTWIRFLVALDISSKLRLIGGLAALLLVVSVSSLLILNVSKSKQSLTEVSQPAANEDKRPASPAVGASPSDQSSQQGQRSPEVAKSHQALRAPGSTLALDLTQVSGNSTGPSLTITPNTGTLELRALIRQEAGAAVSADASYGARLSSGRDRAIELAGQKPSPSGFVVYQVPVSQLRPGDYNLAVFPVPPKTDKPALQYRFTIKQ